MAEALNLAILLLCLTVCHFALYSILHWVSLLLLLKSQLDLAMDYGLLDALLWNLHFGNYIQ